MEKRALIAAVLSILVLFLYQSLVMKDRVKGKAERPQATAASPVATTAPAATTKTTEQAVIRKISGEVHADAATASEATLADAPEETVEVETDLFSCRISTRDASLRSFKLKKFMQTTKAGSPIMEMIKEGTSPLAVTYAGVARAGYSPSTRRLDLTGGRESGELKLTADAGGGTRLTRVYKFSDKRYWFDVNLGLENSTGGMVERSLRLTDAWSEKSVESNMSGLSYFGGVALVGGKVIKDEFSTIEQAKAYQGDVKWAGLEDKYFISAVIPRSAGISGWEIGRNKSEKGGDLVLGVSTVVARVPDKSVLENNFTVYIGPKDVELMKEPGVGLDKAIDFGWFDAIAIPLLWVLRVFFTIAGNWGVAIIILTIIIKLLFLPLTAASYKSMKKTQNLQPKLAELKEKYKNDKERLNMETMSLFKSEGVNPMGGCLPIVVQIPVFIALYQVLNNAIELRHAPFWLWMNDLSAPEHLFDIPAFGIVLPFRLLPLIMGVTMLIQQKMTPSAMDPAQQQIMMLMPVIFTFMFWGMPSGLVIYWLVQNVLSIAQQYYINTTMDAPVLAAPPSQKKTG